MDRYTAIISGQIFFLQILRMSISAEILGKNQSVTIVRLPVKSAVMRISKSHWYVRPPAGNQQSPVAQSSRRYWLHLYAHFWTHHRRQLVGPLSFFSHYQQMARGGRDTNLQPFGCVVHSICNTYYNDAITGCSSGARQGCWVGYLEWRIYIWCDAISLETCYGRVRPRPLQRGGKWEGKMKRKSKG